MHDKPVALVTGANKGIGLQIAKDLVGGQAGICGAVTVVGQQGAEPVAHPGVQAVGYLMQRRVVVRRLGGT